MTALTRRARNATAIELRPFDMATDYEPIADLVTSTNVADGVEEVMTVPSLRLDVAPDGNHHPERDVRVALVDGQRAGFARLSSRHRSPGRVVHRVEVWAFTGWRRRGVGSALLAWAEERGREIKAAGAIGSVGEPHVMSGGVQMRFAAGVAFAEAHGYQHIRYAFEMRRPLDMPIADVPLPPGFELRPVREQDHRAIFDATAEAFRDHWESAERTDDDFRILFAEPALDTSIWAIAWAGDEVAGASLNWIDPDENERLGLDMGWLGQVSVRRPWRRQGVGAAVITESLRTFRNRGMAEARLGVDAENPTGALALYEKLGFERNMTWAIYRKEI
ncbi:MAG TPA: GNAT family N-acetyltransferase [Candidatus Limnocylindria bacterium]|nr:GNAT family N-acetyltransferase [Candidatus Limnocylindria bacterium]